MSNEKHECEMIMGDDDNYYPCNKPAKYVSKWDKEKIYVCGIHARALNRRAKRIGKPMCEEI